MARHGIVSAEAGEDLRAASRALKRAPSYLHRLIMETSAQQLSGAWGEELSTGGGSRAQQAFIARSQSVIPLASGLTVLAGDSELAKPYEFGTDDRDATTTYTRRNLVKPGSHDVTRRTKRQLPPRKAGGHLAYPAANRLGSRVFRMWGALINKVTHDSLEGRG